jgi:uncharacterized protein (DUF58 family)
MGVRQDKRKVSARPEKVRGVVLARRNRVAVKQVLLIAFVLVACVLPPLFVSHAIAYIPLVCFLVTLALCGGYLALVRGGFNVKSDLTSRSCVREGSVSTPLVVENCRAFPLFKARIMLRVINPRGLTEAAEQVVMSITPRAQVSVSPHVKLGHVGVYSVCVEDVRLFDPLGLMSVGVPCAKRAEIVSTPKVTPIDSVKFVHAIMKESPTRDRTVISDGFDYAGVREYAFGDPLKSIHWKLSSRHEGLQTRLFEVDVNMRTVVIADFRMPHYEGPLLMQCSDGVVEGALAAARVSELAGMETRLQYQVTMQTSYDGAVPKGAELEQFTRDLPLASASVGEGDATGLVMRAIDARGGFDNIVIVTSSLGDCLRTAIVDARASHANVTVILIVPREMREQFIHDNKTLVASLDASGVTCIVVADISELEVGLDEE